MIRNITKKTSGLRTLLSLIRIIAIGAVISFGLAGCGEDPAENPGDPNNPDNPGGTQKPALTGTVSITGTAQIGQVLTADTSALGGTGAISYRWKRLDSANAKTGTDIATTATYKVVTADGGKYIAVTVTRADNSGNKTSTAVGPIDVPVEQLNEEDFGADATIETEISVTTSEEWTTAKNTISGGGDNKNYIITVSGAITDSSTYNTFGSVQGVKVSIRGTGSLTINHNGSALYIGSLQTVTLRGPSLIGKTNNNKSLVTNYSTFFLRGGSISGNSATSTSANAAGGGVYRNRGTFTKTGGVIYGRDAEANLKNTVVVVATAPYSAKGQAAYSNGKSRNKTAGESVNLGSDPIGWGE